MNARPEGRAYDQLSHGYVSRSGLRPARPRLRLKVGPRTSSPTACRPDLQVGRSGWAEPLIDLDDAPVLVAFRHAAMAAGQDERRLDARQPPENVGVDLARKIVV